MLRFTAAFIVAWTFTATSLATAHAAAIEITSSLTRAPVGDFSASVGGADSGTAIHMGGGIGTFVSPQIELMASPQLSVFAPPGSGGVTSFGLIAGPVYNFDPAIGNSVFVYAGPGLLYRNLGAGGTFYFQFTAAVGKRFALNPYVSYAPTLSYTGVTTAPYTGSFDFSPIQFSFLI